MYVFTAGVSRAPFVMVPSVILIFIFFRFSSSAFLSLCACFSQKNCGAAGGRTDEEHQIASFFLKKRYAQHSTIEELAQHLFLHN
jgi:hypothetical protein